MHICPHTIRVIEDWAGKKISPRGQSVMVKATTEIIKEEDEQVPSGKKRKNTNITPFVDNGDNFGD